MKNREEILKELNEIAPELSKLEKKQLGKVPANYFSSFPEALMKKIREQELAQIAPTLAQQEKQNVLEVPANYFESFPQEILKKISIQKATKATATKATGRSRVIDILAGRFWWYEPKYAFAIVGTVSMVMIIGAMIFSTVDQCTDLDCKMASLTDTEITTYLDNNTDVYSDEIFESAMDESASSEVIYKDALKDISDEELNKAILD